MKPSSCCSSYALVLWLNASLLLGSLARAADSDAPGTIDAGVAVRDVTPDGPIWLAGYAARKHPSERVDLPLKATAVALRSGTAEPVVLVSLDNCEVSRSFTQPVLETLATKRQLEPGHVMIISSHTHSGPVLHGPLMPMYHLNQADQDQVTRYGQFLQERLVEVVGAAIDDLKPALLEQGTGHTTFAMNRRVFQGDKVVIGENLDGPVDWQVPVLKIKGTNQVIRAILFGYSCHGTSIAGDDFYVVSGDYMAYARQQLESLYPGAVAAYVTGMGGDANPSPRGTLADAQRHGIELAGAVASVLDRPMRSIAGPIKLAYAEVDLPLNKAPSREQLEKDARSEDYSTKTRAENYLAMLDRGQTPSEIVKLPLAILRCGAELTFLAMGGEVVVDYDIRLRRLFADAHPWVIGYAYEVPCYIPSTRVIKEGGYEPESSLIYYGLYGPFQTRVEDILINKMIELGRVTGGR